MWERRGAPGGGGVIYAERAPLPSPLTVPARCSEPEGAQRADEPALGARFSRGGIRLLPALWPVVFAVLRGPRGARGKESKSGTERARGGGASPTPPPPVPAGERSPNAQPAQRL